MYLDTLVFLSPSYIVFTLPFLLELCCILEAVWIHAHQNMHPSCVEKRRYFCVGTIPTHQVVDEVNQCFSTDRLETKYVLIQLFSVSRNVQGDLHLTPTDLLVIPTPA